MINLITGTPGSGKTSYSLKFMLDQLAGSKRKIYVHGIPNLKIPHEKVFCQSKTCDNCNSIDVSKLHPSLLAENWHEYAPDGSIYFLDEAQNIYRPRANGSKVTESVASFEVHRHKGLDFFLITQNPRLIDANIRALVSRHIHLKSNWAGRVQYEWPETKQDVQSVSDAIKSNYKLDKKTFALYQSATIHTKQDRKVPTAVYVMFLSLITASLMSYYVFNRFKDKLQPTDSVLNAVDDRSFDDSNKKIELGGAVVQTDAPSSILIETPLEAYTITELSRLSYKKDAELERMPDSSCFHFLDNVFKCLIPYTLKQRFRDSFCNDKVCFALITIYKNKPKSIDQNIDYSVS